MRPFLLGLSLSIAFVAGSLTHTLTRLIAPSAQAGVPPQKWLYYCMKEVKRPWEPGDLAKLNLAGREGWELAMQLNGIDGGNYDVFCFKRPLN